MTPEVMQLVLETADTLGLSPRELLKQMSYETAGTMNPRQPGPTTKYGQHRGLIQFGEEQARNAGADFSSEDAAWRSQLGKDGAVVKYLKSSGFKPGMSGLDMYSTINAGGPGLYNRSDANNGGAPGTVKDKYTKQMEGHDEKALAILRGFNVTDEAPSQQPGHLGYSMGQPVAAALGDDAGAGLDEPEKPLGRFGQWKAGIDDRLAEITGKPVTRTTDRDNDKRLANSQFLMQNGLRMMNGGGF